MKKSILIIILILSVVYSQDSISSATKKTMDNKIIKLDSPDLDSSVRLMDAINKRGSTRSFSEKKLSKKDLSNLFWVAAGENRDGDGRTVPLLGDISIYVAVESGVYLYDHEEHQLEKIINEDIREKISSQSPVSEAPAVFIFAIDDSSFPCFMKKAMKDAHGMDFYYGNQVAYSTQNIYLYACGNNMNSVVIGGFNRELVDSILGFDEDKNSYLIQLVGYK